MLLVDQWVEKHIKDAQEKGDFDNLPGNGQPLSLDDDSAVPEDLRVAFRILKNECRLFATSASGQKGSCRVGAFITDAGQ